MITSGHAVTVGVNIVQAHAGWKIRWNAEATPAMLARLTIQLPDKYPGQNPFASTL